MVTAGIRGALFPVSRDELVPQDHVCRVIDAFVGSLDLLQLGFSKAQPAGTGRPAYEPADLLKLYLYGYLQQVRSLRRLERECQRYFEVMWLLNRLVRLVGQAIDNVMAMDRPEDQRQAWIAEMVAEFGWARGACYRNSTSSL